MYHIVKHKYCFVKIHIKGSAYSNWQLVKIQGVP